MPAPVDTARLTPKGRAARQRIVTAAAELIEQRGVARTGIDDVRKSASVSGSQMSRYFGDKRSLIRAVISYEADAVLDVQRPFIDNLESMDGLRAWADGLIAEKLAHGCSGGCQFGSLAGELAEADEETRQDLADGFRRWDDLLRNGLTSMRERGVLRPDADPAALALALLAALQGGVLLAQTFRDVTPLRAALDAVLAHVASFEVQ